MGCATAIVKTIVFVFNFLCALVGLILLIIGAIGVAQLSDAGDILSLNVNFLPGFILGLGIVIFVISFLGCCGVMQSSKCMLITYSVLLLVLFVVQFSVSIYGIVQINDFKDSTAIEIQKQLQNATDHYYTWPKEAQEAMDGLQQYLKCCGVTGASDYTTSKGPPPSCCKNNTTPCTASSTSVFDKGCLTGTQKLFEDILKIVSYVALGICAVELVGALFAICLVNSYKNESRRNY